MRYTKRAEWMSVVGGAVALLLAAAGCSGSRGGATEVAAAATGASASAATPPPSVSSASLALKVLSNSCGANQAQQFFSVTNTGSAPINLADISIKYWIDDTSGQTIVPHLYYGGCVSGANGSPNCVHQAAALATTATSFAACGSDPTHQANWEIAITDADPGVLPPGATWSNIQSSFNLANYSNFTPGSREWFSQCVPSTSYNSDPHFAVYFQGNLVFSNGINGPICRAPHGSQQLTGYLVPDSLSATVGPVDPNMPIALDVGLPAKPGLQQFVADVSDPHSANFRHYKTSVADFANAFGASPTDYGAVQTWALGAGFTVANTFPTNLLMRVIGTAAQIEQALFVNLNWRTRRDGTQFVAVDREPSVNLQPALLWISGLTDFTTVGHAGGTSTQTTAPLTQNYYGYDFRNAYLQTCLTGPGGVPLDGTGQTVGVVSLNNENTLNNDVAVYDAAQNPPLNPASLGGGFEIAGVLPNVGGSNSANGVLEVAADVESVQAMAPGAKIEVFEGVLDWESHADTLYHAIATTPGLTVVSSSWSFEFSSNVQQAIWEMAAQGITLTQYSGDNGAIIDPETNQDADGLTLVGGTVLTTQALVGLAGAVNPYPMSYYLSEQTWADGNGSSGGGFMSGGGCGALGDCPTVLRPGYQATLPLASTLPGRLYPDVAMDVYTVEAVNNSTSTGNNFGTFVGTSVAAPLWAGFAALVNQQASLVSGGQLGFANPALYEIGLTRGTANDLYATSFHDIQGGSPNVVNCNFKSEPNCTGTSLGPFTAGPGYDLATGWGTPACGLLTQLSSSTPLTPVTPLTEAWLQIITGKDGLRSDSAATAQVFFQGLPNNPVTIDLKDANQGQFDSGQAFEVFFPVPAGLNLTQQNVAAGEGGIESVTLSLIESPTNNPSDEDNWDIGAINVRLFSPSVSGEMCQIDAVESFGKLGDTNDPGVVRLTGPNPNGSGAGPSASIPLSGMATGCAPTGSPLPAAPAEVQLIVSTGGDTIRSDSDANVQIFGPNSNTPFINFDMNPGHTSAHTPGDIVNAILPLPANAPPPSQWTVAVNLITHNNILEGEGDDHWDVGTVNVMTWQPNGPEVCVVNKTGDPAINQLDGRATLPFDPNCH